MQEGLEFPKGTKYLFLRSEERWTVSEAVSFETLRKLCRPVGQAFSLKEAFREFWQKGDEASGRKFFKKWYFWATHSRLQPFIEVARMLRRHEENLFSFFRHRITNSAAEGINAKVQLVKATARGYRNFENFRVAILFHCGGFHFHPLKRA